MGLKRIVPWYARVAAKVVLSRLPAGYGFWHRLNLFSHGAMDQPDYAHRVYRTHFDRAPFARKQGAYVAMELGPGDSALSAVISQAYGAASSYLVDAGHFATQDTGPYHRMARHLKDQGLRAPAIEHVESVDEILRICHARYETRGLASLRDMPSASIDFIWSQAALEHVRRDEFLPTMQELRRILRPDGVCSHRVDLKDHLGGALNNMRIPSRWWEKDWMVRSGFYTNRLRISEMLESFRQAGFDAQVLSAPQWDQVPIRRRALAAEFRHLDDASLRVKDFDVLLRPA